VEKDCTEIKKRIETLLADKVQDATSENESWSIVIFFREVVKSENLIKDMCDFLSSDIDDLNEIVNHINSSIINKSSSIDIKSYKIDDSMKETLFN
jgi:hypothetical protein